jgi:hypothetical protein
MPPLIDFLRDDGWQLASAVSWWELDQCGRERFLLWSYPWHTMNLLDPLLFRDARRCRVVVSI